jgi:hypothetical protein
MLSAQDLASNEKYWSEILKLVSEDTFFVSKVTLEYVQKVRRDLHIS